MDSVKGYLIEASGITLVFQFAFLYSYFRIIFHMQFNLLSNQNSQGFQLLFNLQIPSKFPPNFSMFSTANQPCFSFTLWYFVVLNKPFILLHSAKNSKWNPLQISAAAFLCRLRNRYSRAIMGLFRKKGARQ